jgi:hypothetical protein
MAWSIDWSGLGRLLAGETRTPEEALNENSSVSEKFARRRIVRHSGSSVVSGREATTTPVSIASSPSESGTASEPRPTELDSLAQAPLTTAPRVTPIRRPEVSPEVEIEQYEAAPTAKSGIVSINCYVPARVYIDGQYSGVTPRTVHLLAGEHQIRLVADGYLEWNNRIQVQSRHQMGVLASMTRAE